MEYYYIQQMAKEAVSDQTKDISQIIDWLDYNKNAPNTAYRNPYLTILSGIWPRLGLDHRKKFFPYIFGNNLIWKGHERSLPKLIFEFNKEDPDFVRAQILKSNNVSVKRLLLCFKNISVEEEVTGLRALLKSKQIPTTIYDNNYAPSFEALSKLPTVMRITVLENLMMGDRKFVLGYNFFENITDKEKFKSLLFGSSMKYGSRAEKIYKKYLLFDGYGKRGTVTIIYDCDKCGKCKFAIETPTIKDIAGYKNSYLDNTIRTNRCNVCGAWGSVKSFVFYNSLGEIEKYE